MHSKLYVLDRLKFLKRQVIVQIQSKHCDLCHLQLESKIKHWIWKWGSVIQQWQIKEELNAKQNHSREQIELRKRKNKRTKESPSSSRSSSFFTSGWAMCGIYGIWKERNRNSAGASALMRVHHSSLQTEKMVRQQKTKEKRAL